MRGHGIRFENCENDWANGLPIGNGVFGSLIYYKENKLFIPLNHYEVYYNISDAVLPSDMLNALPECENPGDTLKARTEKAIKNDPLDNGLFTMYNVHRGREVSTLKEFSGSYPQTGDITLSFRDDLKGCDSLLKLDVESATVSLECKKGERECSVSTIFARPDLVITKIHQSQSGLVKSLNMSLFPARNAIFPDVEYHTIDEHTFGWSVKLTFPSGKLFEYAGVVNLIGAVATLKKGENEAVLNIDATGGFTVLTTVCTDFKYDTPLAAGVALLSEYSKDLENIYREHKEYWAEFFSHCAIELPDEFLERIWYINQYALDCCSGKDGVMKHHACGLNGLWDVKRPNLWGSMWYWDVNIQAAFAGVFSSNHLHLGKVFSDGLKCYTELARRWAHDKHGKGGIAFDYPYACYFSVWPWCAQYLWQYFEYTQDTEYLKTDAYPVFLGLAQFALDIFEYDDKKDKFYIFPDISPEQGPLAHNTVITIGATKKFLRFTLEAAKILGDTDNKILPLLQNLLEKLPDYPTTAEGGYGKRYLDSEDAPANLWIRHPGMLMPCFPAGEIGLNTDCTDEDIMLLSNTLCYLEDRCEVGVFGGSWLAAAAARLGKGQKALRLLYEAGIDHMLRSNGLCAEETERFLNHCLTTRQPLYYPCMVEYTGEMICAVNEMLLQSFGKVISVFPALPDGDPEYDRVERYGYSNEDMPKFFATYGAWKDVRIDTLRTRGAFLISAKLCDGVLEFIKADSLAGKKCRITSPYIDKTMKVYCDGKEVTHEWEDDVIVFDTKVGKSYLIARSADTSLENKVKDALESVTYHTSILKRRVYLGEDADTAYQKAVDGFTRDYMFGSQFIPSRTVYSFDFGYIPDLRKTDAHYDADRFPHIYRNMQDKPCPFLPHIRMRDPSHGEGKLQSETAGLAMSNNGELYDPMFSVRQGFGFKDIKSIRFCDSKAPDCLRRDFAEGATDNEFIIEVSSGCYEVFVCSGDVNADSITRLSIGGMSVGGDIIKSGSWQCKIIPVVMEKDGYIHIKVSTDIGYKWKLNFLYLNKTRKF